MAHVRLTTAMRTEIKAQALAHRFNKELKIIVARGSVAAKRVYEATYSQNDRERMEALPEGWLPETNNIRVLFCGQYRYIEMNGSSWSPVSELNWEGRARLFRPERKMVRIPQSDYGVPVNRKFSCDPNGPLAESITKLDEQRADLHKLINQAHVTLNAALSDCTTVGALISKYPTLEPFAKQFLNDKKSGLPAVRQSDLNALLDLPVK